MQPRTHVFFGLAIAAVLWGTASAADTLPGCPAPGLTMGRKVATQDMKAAIDPPAVYTPGPGSVAGASKPNLYALLIGVSHYRAESLDLGYANADAISLGETLKQQTGKLYKGIETRIITDQAATAAGIKRGMTWLRQRSGPQDVVIVLAVGQGAADANGEFWFLAYDTDPDEVAATAVSGADLSDSLADVPGKSVLFLDVSHRAGAMLNAGARCAQSIDAVLSGIFPGESRSVAYAASTGLEFSFESEQWGHGAFTKALIEGLGGKADLLHTGTITTGLLDIFLESRVKELTDGRQHPVMTRPKTVPDFPIATVN